MQFRTIYTGTSDGFLIFYIIMHKDVFEAYLKRNNLWCTCHCNGNVVICNQLLCRSLFIGAPSTQVKRNIICSLLRSIISPFGVGCIFGFTSVLGGASTLIVDRSYLTRNIRFHFWNCVGLFGTGVLMILFCNYPLVECHLRSDIECYDDINQWSKAFRYGYWSCFLGRGVCGLLIIILSG